MYIQSGQLVKALTTAEKDKNACLGWLLGAWSNDIPTPSWVEIQQLLNPSTAFVYWHLSPAALSTFILKHNGSEPILITTPTLTNEEEPPAAVQRLREFENWVKDWNQQYAHYRSEAKDKENHSWRMGMEQRLEKLRNILNISAIEQELKGIKQLILIPHRDLHRFPIHTLFSDSCDFTITYLPNAQIGINLQKRQPNLTNHLLSVEHPNSQGLISLPFALFESEAISQLFDKPKRIQSEYATKNHVEDALSSEYSIFHFTGHGTYNFSNPKKSELALADEDKLTIEEITQKNLANYNLVTLSACETAITGNQTITTEYVGLVGGFLSRGVAHVVSTLWTVDSVATALVMIEFYRRRQSGKTEAAALAEATQWLKKLTVQQLNDWYEAFLTQLPPDELRIRLFIETELHRLGKMEANKKLYDHPYYWAAFTITGKPC
jgi:CHAT domain-containing protein